VGKSGIAGTQYNLCVVAACPAVAGTLRGVGYAGFILLRSLARVWRRALTAKRRPDKSEEDLLGQVVDFCGQALWRSQELRGRRIIVASLRRFVGIVIYAGHGWSRLVSAGLGSARPPGQIHN
jgi:hypothetical protein